LKVIVILIAVIVFNAIRNLVVATSIVIVVSIVKSVEVLFLVSGSLLVVIDLIAKQVQRRIKRKSEKSRVSEKVSEVRNFLAERLENAKSIHEKRTLASLTKVLDNIR